MYKRQILGRQRGLLSSVLRIFVDEVFLRYGASFKGVAKVQGGARQVILGGQMGCVRSGCPADVPELTTSIVSRAGGN